MTEIPEPKSTTEALDLQKKVADIEAGHRAIDPAYPHVPPDYEVPFLHIGTEKQLFLDNFILDHLEGVERVFPQPSRPQEPVFQVGDLPWEFQCNPFPAAALHDPDDGKFKLWYVIPIKADVFGDSGQVLCYAESTDCIRWEKPLSESCLPYQDMRSTNIVLEDSGHHIALVLNHNRSDPDRKFLMVYNPHDRARARGLRTMSTMAVSPDGLRWTIISEDTEQRHHHFQRALWDESIQKWISYSQYSHHWNFLYRKRQVGRQESPDFIHWSPKEVVLSNDWDPNLPPHLEFHDMSVRKVGGTYIGIVTEFLAEPLWSVRKDTNWRDVAHARLALYCSRDGKRWQRVGGPEPWADNREPGSCDYGFVAPSVAGQLVHGGKTHILYNAIADKQHWFGPEPPFSIIPAVDFQRAKEEWQALRQVRGRYPHWERSINALILREDGWAELRPVYEQGVVITRQFVFAGNSLRLNAACSGGYIRVEILDPNFQPYTGFPASECLPVFSNDPNQIWHAVRWQGDRDLSDLWNKPCRLKFHLHQASLFAFQFIDDRA